jgi:ATP-dependent exoDNAse (exonuclease V) alpha subunit
VHRARNEWEREAWARVRDGQATQALAAYEAHDRLHVSDTREQAAAQMLERWDAARREDPERRTAMLIDASNAEMDRINAQAQQLRAQAGDLGAREAELPGRPYGLRAGDEVMLTAVFYPPGAERVENGSLAQVVDVPGERELTVRTRESQPREVDVNTEEFKDIRLAYAQHVYKAQGRTVDEAYVLMGGWQTDRERAYVALTRARESTEVHVSREDLGEEGMDAGAIERLAGAIEVSNAQQPSIAIEEREQDIHQGHEHELDLGLERDEHEHDRDLGFEL